MIKQTSLESYKKLLDDKDLSRRQIEVYKCFKLYGNLTNKEVSNILDLPINQITPRTNELVKAGFVTEKEIITQKNMRRAIKWGILK